MLKLSYVKGIAVLSNLSEVGSCISSCVSHKMEGGEGRLASRLDPEVCVRAGGHFCLV